MTNKENIKNIVELFIAWNGETEAIDVANLDSAVDFIAESLQEEPVSEDLAKAAITAADEDMQGRQIMEESNEKIQLYSRIFRRGFKAGAKWQKEHLLKSADSDV